ncbi:MAG TPA: phospholipid carrier-dependent glycosyltransferase [Chthoniobacterales bacterium]
MRKALPFLAVFLLFFGSLAFHVRDNAFPYFYHTDEPSKVEQILSGARNGRHPVLLLESAALILKVTGWPPTRNNAALAGRWASAIFASAMIALLFTWGFLQLGWIGGLLAALLAGLQPPLLTAAHFVKEDPALLMGFSATFLAALWYERRPSAARAAWLGAAAGLAISGKWVGGVAIVIAVAQMSLVQWKRATDSGLRLRDWLVFFAAVVAVFLVTNHSLIAQWNTAQTGVSKELVSFYSTDEGDSRAFHLTHYVKRLPEIFPVGLIVLGVAGATLAWTHRGSLHLRLFAIIPFAYFLMISCIPKTENRYLLPVSTMLCMLSAVAVVELLRKAKWSAVPVILVGVWCAATTLVPAYKKVVHSFHNDHRRQLAEWIDANLPADALIAEDNRVALPVFGDPRYADAADFLKRKVLSWEKTYAADYGSLGELRARGVTHIALFVSNYTVLTERGGAKADTPQKQGAARLYQDLKNGGAKPVFVRKKGVDRYLNSGLVLFEIAPPEQRNR